MKPSKRLEKPHIKLRPIFEYGAETGTWFYLEYDDPKLKNLELRWIILHKKRTDGGDWWGVRSNFPDTHENGLGGVAYELKLARQAIKLLKRGT